MNKTAEYVSLGHPDKIADYISCALLDECIKQDASVRYAVEVMVKNNHITLGRRSNRKCQAQSLARHSQKSPFAKSATTKNIIKSGKKTPLILTA